MDSVSWLGLTVRVEPWVPEGQMYVVSANAVRVPRVDGETDAEWEARRLRALVDAGAVVLVRNIDTLKAGVPAASADA